MSTLSSIAGVAQSTEIQGLIKTRNGDIMVLQTAENAELTVYLADTTNVGQYEGMLKARHKEMSMAALIPGLAVKVKASRNDQNQWVAETVRFKGNDLQRARAMEAGMHETKMQAEENRLAAEAHKQELDAHQQQLAAHDAELARQKAVIDEAVARFGQLDDYYIFDELTIYFANGKSAVDPQYVPQLQALAKTAHGINGYMIEVKGFASATGSAAANQILSEERADKVSNILLQQCKVPLTRMLAPGAMGESDQVGNPATKEGEARNRRVVVRVLQNKAVAGKLGG